MASQIHWFPGHMNKALHEVEEKIKLVDVVIELLDARVPLASRNPDIDRLGQGKARLVLLNKSDLASAEENRRWAEAFREKGIVCVQLDSRRRDGMNPVKAAVREACKAQEKEDGGARKFYARH